MTGFKRLVRGAGLGIAGVVSLVLGLLLAERLVRFDVIGRIDTTVLSGLILLFLLPVLTFFAIRHDGRVAARLRGLNAPATDPLENPNAGAAHASAAPAVRTVRHGAHGRDHAITEHRHPARQPARSASAED